MHIIKTAKIFFFFAVLLFVAKPFLGFSIFNAAHHPAKASILVKSFTKRKLEYSENGDFNMASIQKKLADPVNVLTLTFAFLLSIIFPDAFRTGITISNRFLQNMLLSLSLRKQAYLLNSSLLI
jgi:hypothetical protein